MTCILDSLVESKKLPVLFIGSGISRRYLKDFPNWNELLKLSFHQYNDDYFQFKKHLESMRGENYNDFEINTKLASIIESEFNAAFFDRKFDFDSGYEDDMEWIDAGISPYKVFLSSFFKKIELVDDESLKQEIRQFQKLKSKISAIITTNYDLFLEQEIFPNDYTVFTNQSQLFYPDSYNISEIYKIHGSATMPNSIIITENDYKDFNESRKLIIAKMLILFSESPIVFLGYSFTDENIQSIITDFLSCLSNEQLKDIRKHFIFVSHKKDEKELIEINRTITTKSNISIPITEIQTDNYLLVYEKLGKIVPGVSPSKIRETRRIVKSIVDSTMTSNDAEAIIVGIEDLNSIDLSDKPLAIAIGYRETMHTMLSQFGYGIIDELEIFEDILYDNKHFDANSMCTGRFKSIATTRLLPVFKYVHNATVDIIEGSHLAIYISRHDTLEKIIAKHCQKNIRSVPDITSYSDLLEAINCQDEVNRKAGLLLKNITYYSPSQIREICKIIFNYNKNETKNSTNFKRCIMVLDLIENHIPYITK